MQLTLAFLEALPTQPMLSNQLDAEARRGKHRVAILAALAQFDAQHHAFGIDIGDLRCGDLRDAQAGAIGDTERRLVFDAWCRLQKTRNLLGA
jgi:hypothetical protein